MPVGTGDPRQGRAAPSEQDRARALTAIRRCGADGLLSSREVEERIELTFRARTRADLDAVVAALPASSHAAAEMVMTHGVALPAARPAAPWWRGIVLWTVAVNVVWVVIWVIAGGAFGWLVLAMVSSTAAFTVRLATRHRRVASGHPARRRRF